MRKTHIRSDVLYILYLILYVYGVFISNIWCIIYFITKCKIYASKIQFLPGILLLESLEILHLFMPKIICCVENFLSDPVKYR